MCEFCNGTHVYHAWDESKVLFQACPVCGPEPEEKFRKRMQEFREKLSQARLRLELEKEGI